MSGQNTNRAPLRVIISGGGTGGHIFPAIAIANEVRRRHPDAAILFVGAENRMEMDRVPRAGYDIVGLPVMGFDRKRLWRNVKVVVQLLKSVRRARRIVRDFRPDVAVGVGGYASGPTLKAAQKAGVPTLLQEQNSYAGVTNKMLAQKAAAICVAYDGMERFFPAGVIEKTGNPVRADILTCPMTQSEAKKALGFDPERPLVLVVGGSLGSRTLNEAMRRGARELADAGVQVMWQVGKYYEKEYAAAAEGVTGIRKVTFVDDMAAAYRAADIVVSRAGASTISELQLLGKAAILVPSPNVAEDHQTKNALALADNGAAVMVRDSEAAERLTPAILELINDPALTATLADNVRRMALPDSAKKIADKIDQLANGTTGL